MKYWVLGLLFCLVGCSSVNIPNYIPDKHPYKKTFYGEYSEVLKAAEQTLKEYGWEITGRADPNVFERTASGDKIGEQTLLFTRIRETSLVVGSRYARLNAYIRSGDDHSCEVEIRYVTVSSTTVKNFYNYRKDNLIEKMFNRIEELISKSGS